jgi:hypothetical protein
VAECDLLAIRLQNELVLLLPFHREDPSGRVVFVRVELVE